MDAVSLKDRYTQFLQSQIPKELIDRLHREILVHYAKADARALEDFSHLNRRRPRGQSRHYFITDAFLKCGAEQKTTPNYSEDYAVMHCGQISMTHEEHKKGVRPKKTALYRAKLAEVNKDLDPITGDLFDGFPISTEDGRLYASIIIVSPDSREEMQSIPKRIDISIPYGDHSGYHFRMGLEDFIESYDDNEVPNMDITLADLAIPNLRDDVLTKKKQSDDDG